MAFNSSHVNYYFTMTISWHIWLLWLLLSEDVMHKVGQIGRLLVIVPKGQVKSYFQSKLLKSLVWIEQIIYRSDESWLTRYFDDFWSKIWRSGLYYHNRTSATYNYKVFVARWWRISGGWHIFGGWRISEKEINTRKKVKS